MSSVEKVNRELARLDSELRAGAIDRESFRAQRRQLLLDFEERETTTQPAMPGGPGWAGTGTGTETTRLEPTVDTRPPVLCEPPPAAKGAAPVAPGVGRRSLAAIAVYVIGACMVFALAAWWFARPRTEASSVERSLVPGVAVVPPGAGSDTPQTLAVSLNESAWSDIDITQFLQRWGQLSPSAIAAATEDSRIWLLRAETGRRLREARETASLDPSVDSQARVQRLETLQNAIGTP